MPVYATDPSMRKVMFTAPPELLSRLDATVDQLGASRSQVIREAIELYLDAIRTARPCGHSLKKATGRTQCTISRSPRRFAMPTTRPRSSMCLRMNSRRPANGDPVQTRRGVFRRPQSGSRAGARGAAVRC